MSENTIVEGWRSYERKVLPLDAPDTQRREVRLGFYAGASWMLAVYVKIAQMTDDAGVAVIESLHAEATEFGRRGCFEGTAPESTELKGRQ